MLAEIALPLKHEFGSAGIALASFNSRERYDK